MRGFTAAARCIVDPETGLHVGTVILHHHVGALDEAHERGAAGGLLQIEGHRPLVAMEVLEVRTVPRAAHAFGLVGHGGRLDLDDPGSPVRELAHCGRAGPHPGEIEHGEAR